MSHKVLGAVLSQRYNGVKNCVVYASRAMSKNEHNCDNYSSKKI